MVNQVRKAFTLIEILIVVIILGILAAIVVPQFTSATEDAQVSNAETQLQTIRSQIELYRIRNNGAYPDFLGVLGGTFGDPLGATAIAQGLRGNDYLRSEPMNPRTGTSTIIATAATPAAPPAGAAAMLDDGWLWNAGAGEFFCNGLDEALGEWIP